MAVGPVAHLVLRPELPVDTVPEDIEQAQAKIGAALAAVSADLLARASTAPAEVADILRAHVMILGDPVLSARIRGYLEAGLAARAAVDAAFAEFSAALAAGGDYFAERVADLDDLRYRVSAVLLGVRKVASLPDGCILLARDLGPADVLDLDLARIRAFVTEEGGRTSHTAIVARSLGLPAVLACPGASEIEPGTLVLVDGRRGSVTVDPSPEVVRLCLDDEDRRSRALTSVQGPGRTRDGMGVQLLVNIDTEYRAGADADSEGAGLFRTEMLYLDRQTAPGVAEQESLYREVFAAFDHRKVVVRTLDAGADKPLPFIETTAEPNPALGLRGLRISLRWPHLLQDQLTAIAAAAAGSSADVWVMAPMASTVSEVRTFVGIARALGLRSVGVMAEVPAVALRAGQVLEACDFVSIGTNDLAQYTFAADRMQTTLAEFVDPWQPGLLDLVAMTASAGQRTGKPVGVCGEAASDPLLALVLVGLGVTSLSMSALSLNEVRTALSAYDMRDCRRFAEAAIQADCAASAKESVVALAGQSQPG